LSAPCLFLHFRRLGVATQETTPIPHCDRFFVADPDANRVEVIQWLEPYDPARSGAPELERGSAAGTNLP